MFGRTIATNPHIQCGLTATNNYQFANKLFAAYALRVCALFVVKFALWTCTMRIITSAPSSGIRHTSECIIYIWVTGCLQFYPTVFGCSMQAILKTAVDLCARILVCWWSPIAPTCRVQPRCVLLTVQLRTFCMMYIKPRNRETSNAPNI